MENVFHAFLTAALAGLSTGLGGLAVLALRRPGRDPLAFAEGFAGGVMTAVALEDMLPHAVQGYLGSFSPLRAALASASLLVMGMLTAFLLARCVPEAAELASDGRGNAVRTAAVITAAIILHNMPEGVLTMFAGYADPPLGLTLALAVAMHNIPEGIAVAVPVWCATGSRAKGALLALASGLAEPLGAALIFFPARRFLSPLFLDGLLAFIAGVMLYVCAAELFPEGFSARRASAALGVCAGVLAMHFTCVVTG